MKPAVTTGAKKAIKWLMHGLLLSSLLTKKIPTQESLQKYSDLSKKKVTVMKTMFKLRYTETAITLPVKKAETLTPSLQLMPTKEFTALIIKVKPIQELLMIISHSTVYIHSFISPKTHVREKSHTFTLPLLAA